MAKFLTITQRGFYFTVHDADKNVADETWTIERVGAFMAVHHTLNVMATKYAKGLTFRTSVASIMYTLQCDGASSHDLNKITKWLVPQLCDMYEDTSRQGLLGRQLSEILDDVTQMVEQHIAETEAPMTVFGKVVKPEPFFTRPTELEYNAAIEAKDVALAEQLLPETVKVIDKAKCDGIFHKNTAARKVSHLSKALSDLKAAK